MRRTPEEETATLTAVVRALQVFIRVTHDPQCKAALDPDGKLLADWKRTMVRLQRHGEQQIRKLEALQSGRQAKEARRQIRLILQLLDEVKLLGLDSPMETIQ